ncbi:hypothetical protein [Leptospira licerasiae]|uniref:hypothetical protein n=1 Tax=Leptospira licerasiae TaxID=447106 RepID=UPI0010831859|nr:hypothetical protein [Leptospira licerasiae]TGM86779.1 hypothetical protein EHR05_17725 [Leptospira licerasiae]
MKRKISQIIICALALFYAERASADVVEMSPAEMAFWLYSYLSFVAPVPPPADELRGYKIDFDLNDYSESDSDNKIPIRTNIKRTTPLLFSNVSYPVYNSSSVGSEHVYDYSTTCFSWVLPIACTSGKGNRIIEKARITEITVNYLQVTPLYVRYKVIFKGIPY